LKLVKEDNFVEECEDFVLIPSSEHAYSDEEASYDDCGRELSLLLSNNALLDTVNPQIPVEFGVCLDDQNQEIFREPTAFDLEEETRSLASLNNDFSFECSLDELSSALSKCHLLDFVTDAQDPPKLVVNSDNDEEQGSEEEYFGSSNNFRMEKVSKCKNNLQLSRGMNNNNNNNNNNNDPSMPRSLTSKDLMEEEPYLRSRMMRVEKHGKTKKMKRNKVANIAVTCATTSLSEYRKSHGGRKKKQSKKGRMSRNY